MDEDTINDLKQFIAATVSQQTSTLQADFTGLKQDVGGLKQDVGSLKQDVGGLKQDIKRLDQKIDDLSESVGHALDISNDTVDEQIKDHEARITKLEAKAA